MRVRNKEKQARYTREYYLRNREKVTEKNIQNTARLRIRNRDYVRAYLLTHSCVDCGENDPIVLEFDHLRDKLKDISLMVSAAYSIKKIQQEIDKCEVRCANCHRRVTHKRRNVVHA